MRLFSLVLLGLLACGSDPATPGVEGGVMDAGVSDAKEGGAMTDTFDAGPPLEGYYAFGKGGAGSRLFLFFADKTANLCFMVRLIQRANMSGLTLPSGWDVENAGVFREANACTIFYTGQAEYMEALSTSGSVSWTGQALPKTIDTIDVTLNFMPVPWAPGSQDMKAMSVPVK